MATAQKHNPFFIAVMTLMLGACATTAYVGDRYAPTETIDVFYSAKDIPREYKVIGHISEELLSVFGDDAAKQRIINKCKAVGADGVIILGFEYAGSDEVERYQKAEAIKYTD